MCSSDLVTNNPPGPVTTPALPSPTQPGGGYATSNPPIQGQPDQSTGMTIQGPDSPQYINPAPPPNLPTGGMMTPGSLGEQVAQQSGGMMALPGMGGPLQSVGGMAGPPRMTFQDYINMGNTPEQAQAMMSQFGSQ